MGRLDIQTTADAPVDWDLLSEQNPAAGFFARAAWTEAVAAEVDDCEACWIVARRGGDLVGGMALLRSWRGPLFRVVSSFEGTSGGPLLMPGDRQGREETATALLEGCERSLGLRGVSALLCVSATADAELAPVAAVAGWGRRPQPAWLVPLAGGFEHVEAKVMHRKRRKERRLARERGCTIEISTDADALADYYRLYRAAATGWGVAPAPRGLLARLLTDPVGGAFLSLVRYEGRVIGGHFNLHGGDRVTAWNGCTAPEHRERYPSTLLIWADLEEACRRGAAWLDLGASGGIETVAAYKKMLGAEEETRAVYSRQRPWWRAAFALRGSAGRREA